MFSGIIEEVGVVTGVHHSNADAARISIRASTVLDGTEVGSSIAVDGVCQTVVSLEDDSLLIDSVGATLQKTTLGSFSAGRRVNLERPIAYGNRVDGHLVQGHVNDTATICHWQDLGTARWLTIQLPKTLLPYVVLEGSIAIDGVSLTVASLENDLLGFSIIPHTAHATALTDRHVGDQVNVEVDMIAKYVERLAGNRDTSTYNPVSTETSTAVPTMATVEDATDAMARGEMVLLVDDVDRENEGDLVAAAALITSKTVTRMLRQASGVLCAAITPDRAEQLQLAPMTALNTALHGTRFTVSIDATKGTTSGESAHDRAITLRALADPDASPGDFARPGHIFPIAAHPGGLSTRQGHTEAAVELASRAGVPPAAAICPVLDDDGYMARRAELRILARRMALPMLHVAQLYS